MRLLKIMLIVGVIGGVSLLSLNCTTAADTAPQNQTVAVQRGNLTIDITGVGNLALSQKEDLAFEIAGTVAEVLVKEGDTVTKGQVLAKLDTSDWETQLSALEDKVTAAERQLTVKKRALTTAERQPAVKKDAVTTAERQLATKEDAVTTAERLLATKKDAVTTAERQLATKKRNVTAKERDVLQAEINLKDAQTALDTTQVTYTLADFMAAQAAVYKAETELAKIMLDLFRYEPGSESYKIYADLVSSAQSKLESAQAKLDDMLSGFDEELAKNEQQVDTAQWNLENAQIAVEDAQIAVEDAQKGIETAQIAVESAEKGIEDAQIAVENAQKGIDDAQLAVEDTQLGIADAQLAVEDAQKVLDDAQKALAEAQSDHPEIIAPSAGFITKVNVKGGDEVKKGTVAVTLADPNKFEADILVNETDILQTKLGGNASVQVEAIPGMSLPAKVTHIAPTAVIQSGVVNYKVKVEVASLQSVMQARQQAMENLAADNITALQMPRGGSPFSGNVTSGQLSARMRQAIAEGGFSQEQIEEMMKQRQQRQEVLPALSAMIPSDFQLREGQTVTVSILVAERNDVLLVPNGAITRRGMESMVKVLKDGVIEERSITTGISNWQYTEVSGGLSEGEQVVVPQSTATTPTTSTQNQGGVRMIPGMGGFGR